MDEQFRKVKFLRAGTYENGELINKTEVIVHDPPSEALVRVRDRNLGFFFPLNVTKKKKEGFFVGKELKRYVSNIIPQLQSLTLTKQ